MATEKEMYEIIGRAVADKSFREMLIADPEKAASTLGYSLTPDQITSLKESGLGKITDELSTRLSKMGVGCGVGGLGAALGPC